MADSSISKPVEIGDEPIGAFHTDDELVEHLRARAGQIGLSYNVLDQITGLGEGSVGKYLAPVRARSLTITSMLRIATALGVKPVLVVDPALVAEVSPMWERRNEQKVHRPSHYAKRLGPVTIARVLPQIAAELGRRGGIRRRELPAEKRRAFARAAALARWGYVRIDPKTGSPSIQA
jgi:hypothetical protein